jgi:transglutaminase-like putative cysteine protease
MKIRLTIVAATATLLSSIGLYPLFVGLRWVVPGLGAILVVSAAGLLTRRFRLPAAINFFAGLAALHLYVTVLYTAGEAFAWFVPTPASLSRLADLMNEGWGVTNKYAAPVPLVPGVAVLATLGIGLVATVVDYLAVRLRHAAAAGLPLLAMYSVPAAVREESVSWIAFLLGAVGFMGLLLADSREQVTGWGRPVFTRRWSAEAPRERLNPTALAASGYRLGLAAVAIAVLLPTVVPGIHPRGLFGMGGSSGSGPGSQTVTTPDPLVSLKRELTRQDDAVVLTYRTNDKEHPDYLRMYALDRFDGDRWTYSALQSTTKDRIGDRSLPRAPGLDVAPTRPVTTRIQVDRRVKDMTFLPMPYPALRVSAKGDWRVHPPSLMVYSLRDAAGGRTYTVDSLRVTPTAEQLIAASDRAPIDITRRYRPIPYQVPEQIRELAMEKSAGASSPYEKAVKLQEWFTESGEFTYDLSRQSPKHVSDLVDFLTRNKRGYCEQFAAAMALLARTLGIPSRVAMGYTAGTQAIDGSWVVRSRDAHAWPELYFEGTGWVRFEPTPAGGGGQGTASVPAYSEPARAGGRPGETGQATPTPGESAGATAGPSRSAAPGHRPEDLNQPLDTAPLQDSGGRGISPGWIAGALLILLILATPMGIRILGRRRRWAQAAGASSTATAAGIRILGRRRRWAHTAETAEAAEAADASMANAAWTQLRIDAIDYGLPWRAGESPRAAARRISEHLGLDAVATDSLTRIARAEERARYAPSPASPETLRADSRLVREAFARVASPRTRWRARLAPPSALTAFRHASGRVLDAFDLFDVLGSRVGGLLRRTRDRRGS